MCTNFGKSITKLGLEMDIIFNALDHSEDSSSFKCVPVASFFQNIINVITPKSTASTVALIAKYHGLEGRWIGLTPVHWEASHNDSMISAFGAELHLNDAKGKLYFEQCTSFLADDGEEFFYHSPSLWLMKISNKPLLNSPLPHKCKHASLMPLLNDWDSSLYWARLFTEIQMFFAASTFQSNEDATATINGLWFWGDSPLQKSTRTLISDDQALISCLAEHCKAQPFFLESYVPRANDVLVINASDTIYSSHLAKALTGITYRCHYNNAYKDIQAQSWYKRLQRRFL
jgi:hypothetical protein